VIIEQKTEYGYMSYYKNDQVFAHSLRNGKIYEQGLVLNRLSDYVRQSNVIFDIGAHAGSHTILYKYINPDAEIYCFEPQKRMFDLLKHNVEQNKFNKIHLANKAVGHANMKFTMNSSSTDGLNANKQIVYGDERMFNIGGLQVGKGGEEIDIITLDSLGVNKIDFMKIDVEGFEPLVIKGGLNTIQECRPIISFEHNHKMISKTILKELNAQNVNTAESYLYDMKYKIERLDDQGNFLATPL